MLTLVPQAQTVALIVMTAIGYAVATVGIKLTSDGAGGSLPLAAIGAGFLIAAAAEVVLLRNGTLSTVYLIIVAAETLLVLAFALSIGDQMSLRQILGGIAVIGGLALVAL